MTATEAQPPGAPSGGAEFEQGLARLFDHRGELLGAGFLLGRDLVCTCAHVVADDGGTDPRRPGEPLRVDFPLVPAGARERMPATVVAWHPADDIAVLRLDHPVAGTAPLPLAAPDAPLYGRAARLYGFPESTDTGVNAHGVLRGGQGAGLIQLDAGHGSVAIEPGFSGGPVWDVEARHVVGMLATRGRAGLDGTAYLIPAPRLAARAPDAPDDPGPFKGLLRFEESDAHLFTGRAAETDALAGAVREQPLTLLTGQSGTGKSSLLHAGLLPRLRAAEAVVVVRTPQEADGPAATLGEALLTLWRAAVPEADAGSRLTVVREALAGDAVALAALREELRTAFRDRMGVLVLDQFEEYAAAAPSAARQVVTWWRELTAGTARDRGLRAVVSARHATLDVLSAVLPAAERARAVVPLDPLGHEALGEVISARLAPIPGAGLQDGLKELLLRDAQDERRRLVTDVNASSAFMARGKVLSVHEARLRSATRLVRVDGGAAARETSSRFSGTDATSYYRTYFRRAESSGDGTEYGVVSAVGTLADDTWTAVVPTNDTSSENVKMALWPRASTGRPLAVAAVGDGLVRLRLGRDVAPLPFDASVSQSLALDPHHDRFATVEEGRLYLSGPGAATRSVALPKDTDGPQWAPLWVSSEERDRVAVGDANSLRLALYAADDLASRLDVDLAGHLRGTAGESAIESMTQLDNGELAVLLTSHDVLRVDPVTGAVVSVPVRVAPPGSTPRPAMTPTGQLVARPGHPGQALIVTSSGHRDGRLMIWDLVKGRRVANWSSPTGVAWSLDRTPTVLFSPDGRLVAVGHSDRKLRFWDAATGRRAGGVVPYPPTTTPLALVGDHTLVSLTLDRGLRLHRVSDGGALGEGPASVSADPFAATASGTRVRLTAGGQLQSLDVDPDAWWRDLCRAADRPYTKAERGRLPAGARTGRPCAA
ncbi:nSTAND1 domain-containing NTPase [Streptomyces tricolor]